MSLVLPKSGHQTKTALGPEHHHRSSRHQISPPRSVHTFQVLLPGKTHEKKYAPETAKKTIGAYFFNDIFTG